MPSLDDIVRERTALGPADQAWLHRLCADWQIIADLSFADLVLWLPDRADRGLWAAAQMRPTTGPTALVDDVAGGFCPWGHRALLDRAWREGRIARDGDPEWRDEVPVRLEAIPVRRADRLLGVVARTTNLLGIRTPSRLELSYLQTAADLAEMITAGDFPYLGERPEVADSIRVGDGFVRTDAAGTVTYASPNGLSAFRRLGLVGDLVGQHLASTLRRLVQPSAEPVDEDLAAVVSGRAPRAAEVESATASLSVRVMPLRRAGQRAGGLLLLRDVTELRRRERELVTKEATIREIHHRVKNNLQAVAALLRLQARRMAGVEGRSALDEAVRRVGAIAVVHETLSQSFEETVDFDEVADRLRAMVVEVSASGAAVTSARTGSFGSLPAELATSLAMVLTELMQNAVEHGYGEGPGQVRLWAGQEPARLLVRVEDDGRGLPAGSDPLGAGTLGMSIVRTLVESELGGSIRFGSGDGGAGTVVTLQVPLDGRAG